MNEERPSSAYPDPLSPLIALIVRGALEAYQSGEIDVEGAILHAAVNGWYEGHIEGDTYQINQTISLRHDCLEFQDKINQNDMSKQAESHS